MNSVTAPVAPPAQPDTPKDPLASLAAQVRFADTGTLARLRRTDPLKDRQSALFETERLLQLAQVHATGPVRDRWALLLHCLALVQGRHDQRTEVGTVLQRLNFSEARVRQLVEADTPMLMSLLPRLARRLGLAGAAVNWWTLADLLLYADGHAPGQRARADAARQRLVRHYLSAQEHPDAEAAASRDA